jgi:hypothetical protein
MASIGTTTPQLCIAGYGLEAINNTCLCRLLRGESQHQGMNGDSRKWAEKYPKRN